MKSQIKLNALLGGKPSLEPETVLVGKYVLKSFAGQGGMGEVWRAWDSVGGRFVALKFISSEVELRDKETLRMQETFRMVGELNHQHICPYYGLEYDSKFGLFLAMKWLGGVSLDEIIRYNKLKQGRMPIDAVFQVLRPIAEALDYSHAHSILHRDVKPSNIFVTVRNGKACDVYLIDFGLASLTQDVATRETSGTCMYMSPEQWKGDAQNFKTDLYALGAIAYEMYSGKTPFFERNLEALRCAVLHDPLPSIPSLPNETNAVLAKCLAKNRDERYGSCLEFVRELERASKSIPRDPSSPGVILAPRCFRQTVDAAPKEKNDEEKRAKVALFSDHKRKKPASRQTKSAESKTVRIALLAFASAALVVAVLGFAFVVFQTVRHLIG